jgi:hypothetical protein
MNWSVARPILPSQEHFSDDQHELRPDRDESPGLEIRKVRAALRGSKYRDLVTVEHLPAATSMDLLDGLNDHRPHVVHFSGHASSLGLLMGSTPHRK